MTARMALQRGVLAAVGAWPLSGVAATLTVGPAGMYPLPSDAAAAARDGDIIEIAAGTYHAPGIIATWRANSLTLWQVDLVAGVTVLVTW